MTDAVKHKVLIGTLTALLIGMGGYWVFVPGDDADDSGKTTVQATEKRVRQAPVDDSTIQRVRQTRGTAKVATAPRERTSDDKKFVPVRKRTERKLKVREKKPTPAS
ncbi:MAG: hypothetical protein ACYTHJ_20650 [Planctomycetota bacterium]|jgi:hypothetical protein